MDGNTATAVLPFSDIDIHAMAAYPTGSTPPNTPPETRARIDKANRLPACSDSSSSSSTTPISPSKISKDQVDDIALSSDEELVSSDEKRDITSLRICNSLQIVSDGFKPISISPPNTPPQQPSSMHRKSLNSHLASSSSTPRKLEFSQLPSELQLYTLTFLDTEDLMRCSMVSRSWHALAKDGSLWTSVSFRNSLKARSVNDETFLKIINCSRGFLRSAYLQGCVSLTDVSLQRMISITPSIESLDLTYCRSLQWQCLADYFSSAASQLRMVKLSSLHAVNDLVLEAILCHCPLLQTLDISGCTTLTTNGMRKAFSRIQSRNKMSVIPSSAKLYQDNSSNSSNTASSSSSIGHDEDDEEEEVEDNDANFAPRRFKSKRPRFSSDLSEVVISHIDAVNDNVVHSMLSSVGDQITVLSMASCNLITNETVKNIGLHCRELQGLDLSRCTHISDAGLVLLGKGCPNLRWLTLKSLPLIVDVGLGALGKQCKQLEKIHLEGCRSVSDEGIFSLIGRDHERLSDHRPPPWELSVSVSMARNGSSSSVAMQSISVNNMEERMNEAYVESPDSTAAIKPASNTCPLVEIVLAGCENLSPDAIRHIANYCGQLRHLDVSDIPGLNDDCLSHLAKKLWHLETLDIHDCRGVSAEGVEELIKLFAERRLQLNRLCRLGHYKWYTRAGAESASSVPARTQTGGASFSSSRSVVVLAASLALSRLQRATEVISAANVAPTIGNESTSPPGSSQLHAANPLANVAAASSAGAVTSLEPSVSGRARRSSFFLNYRRRVTNPLQHTSSSANGDQPQSRRRGSRSSRNHQADRSCIIL